MPKLTRYLQKIFANNSDQVGVFGTGVDKETSKNVETLQSADYESGWSSAIITNKNYPVWQERDGVDYGFSYQLAYLMQTGMPEWLSTETYYTNSFCRYGAKIYYSLQDDNTNHNPALNDGYWEEFLSGLSHDIDEIATDLNGKADVDLSNINASQSAKNEIVSWGMPDYGSGISVSNLPYTAPSDGYIKYNLSGYSGSAQSSVALIDGIEIENLINANNGGIITLRLTPISKNSVFSIQGGYQSFDVVFYPMKGVN